MRYIVTPMVLSSYYARQLHQEFNYGPESFADGKKILGIKRSPVMVSEKIHLNFGTISWAACGTWAGLLGQSPLHHQLLRRMPSRNLTTHQKPVPATILHRSRSHDTLLFPASPLICTNPKVSVVVLQGSSCSPPSSANPSAPTLLYNCEEYSLSRALIHQKSNWTIWYNNQQDLQRTVCQTRQHNSHKRHR